jgi:hypothetical protein
MVGWPMGNLWSVGISIRIYGRLEIMVGWNLWSVDTLKFMVGWNIAITYKNLRRKCDDDVG